MFLAFTFLPHNAALNVTPSTGIMGVLFGGVNAFSIARHKHNAFCLVPDSCNCHEIIQYYCGV